MSTRKLILVSLLLGVVILVAFAVQLVLASQQAGYSQTGPNLRR